MVISQYYFDRSHLYFQLSRVLRRSPWLWCLLSTSHKASIYTPSCTCSRDSCSISHLYIVGWEAQKYVSLAYVVLNKAIKFYWMPEIFDMPKRVLEDNGLIFCPVAKSSFAFPSFEIRMRYCYVIHVHYTSLYPWRRNTVNNMLCPGFHICQYLNISHQLVFIFWNSSIFVTIFLGIFTIWSTNYMLIS